MRFKKLLYPYLIWILIFILVPVLLVVYYSFTIQGSNGTAVFSIKTFQRFFTSKYSDILIESIKIALYTTVICLFIGYPLAYFISKSKAKVKNVMILLTVIPMWMNFLLRTYAWVTILNKNGILNMILSYFSANPLNLIYTEKAVLIGMVYNFLPFMVLPIYSSLAKTDKALLEASMDLGATDRQSFWKVTFPLSLPGVLTGITMVFIPSISTFEISSLLGGNKYNLIGNVIEQQFRVTGDWNFGSSMSLILLIFILISILITNKFGDDEGGGLM